MRPPSCDIAVTGAGAACAVGTGCEALWNALAHGRDGLREIQRFPVGEFSTRVGGLWPAWDGRTERISTLEMACAAAREAWTQSQGRTPSPPPERVAVILGTCFGEDFVGFSELTQGVAAAIGARGPCLTVSTACSSSTAAVGMGRDLIDQGVADLVLAGGADVLTREVFAGFHALGALSPGKCTPFGETHGTTLGEGAGFVVLESAERAGARSAPLIANVLGYGLSGDAFHDTSPDPSGSGISRAVRGALADAGVEGGEIDYVCAHGTGTESNDVAEWIAIRRALGAGSDGTPVSAIKSFLGHAQGAAGVLELISTLLCVRRGLVPPTLRCARPRPGAPPDPVASARPRAHVARRFLKVSAAFGGANAALVVGTAGGRRPAAPPRFVEVAGVSALGPHGLEVAELERAVLGGRKIVGAVPEFDLSRVLPWVESRSVDPSGRYASAAAGLALADARISVRGAVRERSGLVTGNSRMPSRSAWECRSSIEERGITGVAAVPFAHMTLNAPAGTCAKLLSLRGPLLAFSVGRGSGLAAIVWAAAHLASRDDADLLVAGGLDELPMEGREGRAEGAAFAALAAAPARSQTRVRLEGWGLGGPDAVDETIRRAIRGIPEVDGVFAALPDARRRLAGGAADPSRLPLGLVDLGELAGGAESTASAFAFVLAAARLRRREARRLLVVAGGDSVTCAAVLAAPEG